MKARSHRPTARSRESIKTRSASRKGKRLTANDKPPFHLDTGCEVDAPEQLAAESPSSTVLRQDSSRITGYSSAMPQQLRLKHIRVR